MTSATTGPAQTTGPVTRRVHAHTCPLCEATCGLLVETVGDQVPGVHVTGVRGDPDDVFSKGFACPKGLLIGRLNDDPDRLRTPLVDGEPATWDQAWQAVHERLGRVVAEHGRESLGVYLGNPNVHNLAGSLYAGAVIRALGTRSVFSASTSDQMPKQVAAVLMFGDPLTVPIPDVDRTQLLVVLGADPLTSNGSLMTAPDMPGRLRALRRRGGRLVVVDPRTSRTARAADTHLRIRPGADAWLRQVEATVVQHLGEPGELFFARALREFDVLEALLEPGAVLLVGLLVARDREDAPFRRQLAVAEGLEQRGHQLAPSEVAGAAEEDEIE